MVPIDSKSALLRVMPWRRTGETPLPEPMMPDFVDAYMRHKASVCYVTTTISRSPLWMPVVSRNVNTELSQVYAWLAVNKLSLNVEKHVYDRSYFQ